MALECGIRIPFVWGIRYIPKKSGFVTSKFLRRYVYNDIINQMLHQHKIVPYCSFCNKIHEQATMYIAVECKTLKKNYCTTSKNMTNYVISLQSCVFHNTFICSVIPWITADDRNTVCNIYHCTNKVPCSRKIWG